MSGELSTLFASLSQFGAFGILVAFLIWKDLRADKARERLDSEHRAEVTKMQERRIAYDRERLESDKDRLDTDRELASALASLTSAIQSRMK